MPKFERPTPTFQTTRLVLRPMALTDAPEVQRQFERFEVVQYLNNSVPWPYPPGAAEFFLREVQGKAVKEGSEQAWALLREGQFIGSLSFSVEGDEQRGFWLNPEFWGQGLMTEACCRVTEYIMGELGWPEFTTGNAVSNVASSRLKKSQGFEKIAVFEKDFVGGADAL